MKNNTIVINFEEGLHARPATKFVQMAKGFDSDIKVIVEGKSADAKSILDILTLGVMKGTEITIQADGTDEIEAVSNLSNFVQYSE